MDSHFSISIKHGNWAKYWRMKPDVLLGEKVIVRGWVTRSNKKYRTNIGHPAMLETVHTVTP